MTASQNETNARPAWTALRSSGLNVLARKPSSPEDLTRENTVSVSALAALGIDAAALPVITLNDNDLAPFFTAGVFPTDGELLFVAVWRGERFLVNTEGATYARYACRLTG